MVTKRLAHKECPCWTCAERVREEKRRQDAHIWAKVPVEGLTYQQRALRAYKLTGLVARGTRLLG